MVTPDTVTVFPVPNAEESNSPDAADVLMVIWSPLTTPTNSAKPVARVAVRVVAYVRSAAVMPDTVRFLAVMFAVVVGWVSV